MKPVIETHQLGKKFALVKTERYQALRDVIGHSLKTLFSDNQRKAGDFWALQDINITIRQGERVGVIGKNGAGKSTLLKILSSITLPTTGSAKIRGRIGSLLEVGTGFHPELTGRENIFFNGAVLGMQRAEIRSRFDEIVEFSGVSSFLDTPLKHYSTGMELRLAFAVAAHLEPEVLLIDEVLAVGDIAFQKKCLQKMDEVSRNNGKTIVFVSHNIAAVKNLCETAILLNNGRIVDTGTAADVVSNYLKESFSATPAAYQYTSAHGPAGEVYFKNVYAADNTGNIKKNFLIEDPVIIHIEIDNSQQCHSFSVGIAVNDTSERRIITDSHDIYCNQGETRIYLQLALPRNILTPGTFMIDTAIEKKGIETADFIKNAIQFDIIKSGTKYESLNYDYGVINTKFDWTVKKK